MNLSQFMRTTLILAILFITAFKPGMCESAFLYGRVELQDHPPASKSDDYFVEVTVQYETPHNAKSIPQNSKYDLYSYRVIPSVVPVRLHFFACNYKPQNSLYQVVAEPHDIAIYPPIKMMLRVPKAKPKSSQEVQQMLKQESAFYNVPETYDILQYNLAMLRYEFRNNRELNGSVEKFMNSSSSEPFMTSRYTSRQPLYLNIIRRNGGEKIAIAQNSLLLLMKDADAFAGIRASAIKALAADTNLQPDIKAEFLNFLHQQTTSSNMLLFRPSRTAIAKIGTSDDRKAIMSDLDVKNDSERVLASLIAIRNSRLDDPSVSPDTAEPAKEALDRWDNTETLPTPSRLRSLWNSGVLAAGLKIESFTSEKILNWHSIVQVGDDVAIKVVYPANQKFGILQISRVQTGNTTSTSDFSDCTELVVEMRSEDPDRNIDVGIKGVQDDNDQTPFKRTFTDVSTEYKEYHLPLQGQSAQLSGRAASKQRLRLESLQILTELAFGAKERQVFYIRKIYFARP